MEVAAGGVWVVAAEVDDALGFLGPESCFGGIESLVAEAEDEGAVGRLGGGVVVLVELGLEEVAIVPRAGVLPGEALPDGGHVTVARSSADDFGQQGPAGDGVGEGRLTARRVSAVEPDVAKHFDR